MSKKHSGTMADQLKAAADRLKADEDAARKAQKAAASEKARQEQLRRDRAEEDLDDNARFERAMNQVHRTDVAKKFDTDPGPAVPGAPGKKVPPPSDEEMFERAMTGLGKK